MEKLFSFSLCMDYGRQQRGVDHEKCNCLVLREKYVVIFFLCHFSLFLSIFEYMQKLFVGCLQLLEMGLFITNYKLP